MYFILKTIGFILFFYFLFYISTLVLSFFNIQLTYFLGYFFFVLAMLIFYIILPKNRGLVFN